MAVEFIFVATILTLILLAFAFVFKDEIIAAVACFAMMTIGVSVLVSGVVGLNNMITLAFGTIFVCFGFYILMKIQIEYIEDNLE